MAVPFADEMSHVGDGQVNILVFRAFDKGRKAVVVAPDIDNLPVVFFAHSAQVIQIFCLEGLVICAGVASGRKFVVEILFKLFEFSHGF